MALLQKLGLTRPKSKVAAAALEVHDGAPPPHDEPPEEPPPPIDSSAQSSSGTSTPEANASTSDDANMSLPPSDKEEAQMSTSPPEATSSTADVSADPPPPETGDQDVELARKTLEAFTKRVDAEFVKAQKEVDAQPVAALKTMLTTELDKLRASRKEVDKLDPVPGAARIKLLDSQASTFTLRATGMKKDGAEGKKSVEDWGEKPLAVLGPKVKALPADTKKVFEPRLKTLQDRLKEAQEALNKGDFDGVVKTAGPLFYACQDLTTAIDTYTTEFPLFKAERVKVVAMIDRMKNSGLMDADGAKSIADLEAALGAADAVGPIKGYKAARASLNGVVNTAKTVRDTNAAYKDFQPERDKAALQIEAIKKHPQAKRMTSEIKAIEDRLKAADALAKRADGGSLKALTALKPIAGLCAELKTLGDKLVEAEKKLPALSKKLEGSGVPKDKVEKTAGYAVKLLVEENCSDDDAVKMAKDASGYTDEGLAEQDAIMSSRVKKSLEDSGLTPDHAKEIGKNIRAGGTASAEDAKALGQAMKGVSKKAIETLNKSNITTECCRGAITDAMPDLAGVKPRGWPETATWDDVPGVYSGSKNKLVVGTMNDGGKRVVPGPGKGPLKHGATDLFGHEAGHAFDAADGGGKRSNAAFLTARGDDITTGNPGGMYGPRDSYFLTKAEGGANDSGATSETFAESFAMHFSGKSRWPKLEAFWASNPWGV